MRELMNRGKDREIIYQFLSWAKQDYTEKINLIYSQLKYILLLRKKDKQHKNHLPPSFSPDPPSPLHS